MIMQKEPRYLLFWRTCDQVPALVKTVGMKGDGHKRILGIGLPCATFFLEKQVAADIHQAFAVAREHNIAIMLHYDFHIAWDNRPDLWNWFDPKQPGYNPANKRNVEWFGWDGPVARVRYLNHGIAKRMAPPMCLTSKAVRAEWVRLIHKVIIPPLKQELADLKRAGKMDLFAGVLVGSEPTFDNYTHTDTDIAKLVADDGAPKGQLGYRALLDRGYSAKKVPANIPQTLGKIIQETVGFWCKQFVDAGLPKSKLYTHIAAGAQIETTCAPIWTAFNKWSRPGWSTYAMGPLERNFNALYADLKKNGNPPWGGIEANAGMPGTVVDWETYMGWHYNHGATIVAVNLGATGTDLPQALERGAFSAEALAVYHKVLKGEKLIEKPVTNAGSMVRIQRKMQALQKGFSIWQKAGRDPSAIGRSVEQRVPALLEARELLKAETVLDEALKQLNEKP